MEKPREFSSKKRYVLAFIIGTILFLLIFLISYSISYFEINRVSGLQTDISYNIFEDRLDYSFFNEPVCSAGSFEKISQDLGFQGRIIDDLETKLGKQDKAVLARKKFYTLVELEHLEFVKLINERCDGTVNTILFFYSNNKSEIDISEEAGRILGVVHQRNINLVIYSFDVDLNSDLVNKLKNKYNVADSPIAVINEKVQVKLPANILEIEKHLI